MNLHIKHSNYKATTLTQHIYSYVKILSVLLIFVMAGCASLKDEYSHGADSVSCRITCRNQGDKIPVTNKDGSSCGCIDKPVDAKSPELVQLELLTKKLDSLQRQMEEKQKIPVCVQPPPAPLVVVPESVPAPLLVNPDLSTPKEAPAAKSTPAPAKPVVKKKRSNDALRDAFGL